MVEIKPEPRFDTDTSLSNVTTNNSSMDIGTVNMQQIAVNQPRPVFKIQLPRNVLPNSSQTGFNTLTNTGSGMFNVGGIDANLNPSTFVSPLSPMTGPKPTQPRGGHVKILPNPDYEAAENSPVEPLPVLETVKLESVHHLHSSSGNLFEQHHEVFSPPPDDRLPSTDTDRPSGSVPKIEATCVPTIEATCITVFQGPYTRVDGKIKILPKPS